MRQRSVIHRPHPYRDEVLEDVLDVEVLDSGALIIRGEAYTSVYAPGGWLNVVTTAAGGGR